MRLLILSLAVAAALGAQTRPLPKIEVHPSQRFLQTADGKPFFYLADTAWELFHRLNREQAVRYLGLRAAQGYNAIQAVAIAELDGPRDPNPYGDLPFHDADPARPAVTPGANPRIAEAYDYWDHVDYIVEQANARGLYIALLPTWGSWVNGDERTSTAPIFTPENAEVYGRFLGERYRSKGVIWVLGGDRTPTGFEATWRAMAKGIAIGVSGREDYGALLMTFHPRGGQTSSTQFHADPWLDFNMWQTGHGLAETVKSWEKIAADYALSPTKPVVDGEPLYEDHPLAFRAREHGYSFDAHIRQRAYWAVFSGAAGHTYGNHSVWQMYAAGRRPVNGPLFQWHEAIHRPGAAQMQHLKRLVESRPYFSRVPAPSLIVDPLDGADRVVATRGDGYAFVYSAQGRKFAVKLDELGVAQVRASWVNPRTGAWSDMEILPAQGVHEFVCPSEGFGSDWTLVLDDASRNFARP